MQLWKDTGQAIQEALQDQMWEDFFNYNASDWMIWLTLSEDVFFNY